MSRKKSYYTLDNPVVYGVELVFMAPSSLFKTGDLSTSGGPVGLWRPIFHQPYGGCILRQRFSGKWLIQFTKVYVTELIVQLL